MQTEADARGRAYVLLADLLTRGPVVELEVPARCSDVLAAALDTYPDLDEAAADHQHVFGFCVPPLEGLFLDPEGTAGGSSAARVAGTFAAVGYRSEPTRDEPEHLGTELRAMGVLCGAEADAHRDAHPEIVAELERLQAQVLDAHVLRWLPVFGSAVRRIERAFPIALVEQIEDLVRMHRESLGAELELVTFDVESIDLDDANVDLRAIAHYLVTPLRAGLLLSKDDIARVGRAFRLPRGFTGRALMMQNLLRAAAQFDALGQTCAALVAIVDEDAADLARWPAVRVGSWRERAVATRAILQRLGDAPREVG